jgi:hypothetical protein
MTTTDRPLFRRTARPDMTATDDWPPPHKRRVWPWALAALGLVLIGSAGWYVLHLVTEARIAHREAGRVGELHEKLATRGQPLTDDEFAELLSLCDTADPEARFVALITATAYASRYRPDLKARAIPVAQRLTDDRDAEVRRRAGKALASLTK